MRINPDNDKLLYCGRIDWSHQAPIFVFPCSSVRMRFTGSILKVFIRNRKVYWNNYLGCILDGTQTAILLPENGEACLKIDVTETERDWHEVMLFKRQDACHEFAFLGMEIGDGEMILDMPKQTNRRIEVYGDSVSAGEVSEAVAYTGKEDPVHNGEYSNSWYSYAWITARKLKAQIHDIAQGGIALLDGTGWFCEPQAVGMETIWDKIRYHPMIGEESLWDFSAYLPQVVIVAIGQNDCHPVDYMAEDREGILAGIWRERYRAFLKMLRSKYPDAYLVCCTTLLRHENAWDWAIGEVVREMEDAKITQYLFRRNGNGTPGHLRIAEAEEMAEELAAYIENLDVKGWESSYEAV